jgi:hypothetical protein
MYSFYATKTPRPLDDQGRMFFYFFLAHIPDIFIGATNIILSGRCHARKTEKKKKHFIATQHTAPPP